VTTFVFALVRGFVHLVSIDAGFNGAGVMLTRLPLRPERYDTDVKIDHSYAALLERLAATPGIESAAHSAGSRRFAVHLAARHLRHPRRQAR
jgi:hypothetical protein